MLRIAICLLLLASSSFAVQADANFDAFNEAPIGTAFTEGGISFRNLDCNIPPGPYLFTAERADGDLAGFPGFSPTMCLGFLGFSPGPSASFGRVRSFEMTTGFVHTWGSIEVFELGSYAGNSIHLEALSAGFVVATDTVPIATGGGIHHYTLSISGVAFDTLRLRGSGPTDGGTFFALVDDVHIGVPPGVLICPGDGSGTACPCGNHSAVGADEGCLSSLGIGGTLRATGSASLAADTIALNGGQMPDAPCLYFQGTTPLLGGAGTVFGDGLRCAGGSIVRLGTKTNAAGSSMYPGAGDASVSSRGQVAFPGTRVYQVWYRNAATFCTGFTFNLTNALEVTWTP